MTARFMRSCGASLMRMKGMADDDEYEEEEAVEEVELKKTREREVFRRSA
jgi:hypothetical protein